MAVNHPSAAWQICFQLSNQDTVIYGAHEAAFPVRGWFSQLLSACPCLPVARVMAGLETRGGEAMRSFLCCWGNKEPRGTRCHNVQTPTALSNSWDTLGGPPTSTASATSPRWHLQSWWTVYVIHQRLIPNKRKFIFNWAKIIQGKTKKPRRRIKSLLKASPTYVFKWTRKLTCFYLVIGAQRRSL